MGTVKHTFIHYTLPALRRQRRCTSAPPQHMTRRDDVLGSTDEDTVSCSDSSQTSFSVLDADSGASTPECFSPRGHCHFAECACTDTSTPECSPRHKFATYRIADP